MYTAGISIEVFSICPVSKVCVVVAYSRVCWLPLMYSYVPGSYVLLAWGCFRKPHNGIFVRSAVIIVTTPLPVFLKTCAATGDATKLLSILLPLQRVSGAFSWHLLGDAGRCDRIRQVS